MTDEKKFKKKKYKYKKQTMLIIMFILHRKAINIKHNVK